MFDTVQLSIFDMQTVDGEEPQFDDFDRILQSGSGFYGGKARIEAFCKQGASLLEMEAFLKREYGNGGRSFSFNDGENGVVNYDAKGIFAARWNDYGNGKTYSWKQVAKRIKELIIMSKY